MASHFKVCPICGTHSQANAAACSTCGTSLIDVPLESGRRSARNAPRRVYDRRYGETDLIESETSRSSGMLVIGGLLLLPLLICAGVVGFLGARSLAAALPTPIPPTLTSTAAAPPEGNAEAVAPTPSPAFPLFTNTPFPTPRLATVTPAPPTATLTPTQGPCERRVEAGQDLISLAFSCGHRSMDVLPLILEMNNLSAPEALVAGQLLMIPLPTPTSDPNAAATLSGANANDTAADSSSGGVESVLAAELAAQQPIMPPTETLLPGVAWHVIQPDQSMIEIAYLYQTSAEVLSYLNPEITFSQCDYSLDSGGPRCTVLLQIGQQMRVPAPTPTPTLSPTPSGSETPTPTITPTFNAPSPLSPSNRALFLRGEWVTLRWVPTGTLGENEFYLVRITNTSTDAVYDAYTTQLYYIVPESVQETDGQRHDYRWTISVVRGQDPSTAMFTTQPRLFTWEARALPTGVDNQ